MMLSAMARSKAKGACTVCRSYGLPVRDREGRLWEFVVKSWANGTEHRRVYVLEHVSEFIACKCLREGDAVGICADAQGALIIEVEHAPHTEAPCKTVPSQRP